MGCMQTRYIVEEPPVSDAQDQYTLNAMRSLEGVAQLWSKRIGEHASKGINMGKKRTFSGPVAGNHTAISNDLPIAVSTYFFLKSPSDQPNLLRSHTSPHDKLYYNQIELQILECDHIYDPQNMVIHESVELEDDPPPKYNEGTEIENKMGVNIQLENENENDVILAPISPHLFSTENILSPRSPHFNLNLKAVFSNSHSMASPDSHSIGSPKFFLPSLAFNDNEPSEWTQNDNPDRIRMTLSENNVLHLNDMHLHQDDFMIYNTDNLGIGASGVVTKAFHFSSCRMVAIKQCRSKQEHEILAFEKEATLYKKFKNNPNIIDLIGFGRDHKNEDSLMALELMGLRSTNSLKMNENIKDMRQREIIVGYIALNVLLALNDVHQNNYVHNDIKPENILCNKYGEVKLSDFGTMLQLQDSDDFLYKNNGTQRYQSPEKITFDIKYNTKSDIWSLGITCYELLFGEDDTDEISYTTNPPILSSEKHNLSKNCCDFINQCLTINQFDRPNASNLLKHLWFKQNVERANLTDKWPWIQYIKYQNEDLLFMITALISYYSTKHFNDKNSGSIPTLHKRVSIKQNNKNGGQIFSDQQRIENMAKYAFCPKDYVVDRIKVTVSYIKSQLNKTQ